MPRSAGGKGGKGKGRNSMVQSIYQHATAFLSPMQQDAISGLQPEDIVVVPGHADKIETVLEALGLKFRSLAQQDLQGKELLPSQPVFVNCCANCGPQAAQVLGQHMNAGGVVVTTDHEVQHLLERIFPDVVQHVPLTGNHDACLRDVDTTHCASCCFPCGANWHIDGGAHGVRIRNHAKCKVLVKSSDVKEENIMIEILHGKGRAIHLVSHFEQVSRHMRGSDGSAASPAQIAELAKQAGVSVPDDAVQKLLEGQVGFRQLQTAIAGITMLVNVLVLARLGRQLAPGPRTKRPPLQVSPQEALYGLAQGPVTLHSDVAADGRVQELRSLLRLCLDKGDLLFPLKLAAHIRRTGGHRETALCMLAACSLEQPLQGFLALPAQKVLLEPGSLVRVVEWTRVLNNGTRNIPSSLKKALRLAFSRVVTLEGLARVYRSTHGGLGMIIRHCHITEPSETVAAILGKRYPLTEEAWHAELGAEVVMTPELLGARRKVPRDTQSVAVKMSEAGKGGQDAKEAAWSELLMQGKLTAKELARNLVSILAANLSSQAMAALDEQLQTPRFFQHVTFPQLYVAWRQVENPNLQSALQEAASKKRIASDCGLRRILILIDVSPSMSRPVGAGTSSLSCKESAVLLSMARRQVWAANTPQQGWFRVRTFPSAVAGSDVEELSTEGHKDFKAALDLNGKQAWPGNEQCIIPWKWLESDECGEAEEVLIVTDEDFTTDPRWSTLKVWHHGKGRTWWQLRCVNLRGSPGSGRAGAEASGVLVNGCDEGMFARLMLRPGEVLHPVHNLVFERMSPQCASAAVVMLKTQQPRFTEGILRRVLDYAAPLRLEEKWPRSQK